MPIQKSDSPPESAAICPSSGAIGASLAHARTQPFPAVCVTRVSDRARVADHPLGPTAAE